MNAKAEAAEPAEFSVSDRLQRGASLALTHVADTWGSQEARGEYLLFPGRRRYLLNELQIAIRNGKVRLFDTIRKRERGYRDDDADAVQRGVAQVLPASVNAWLEAEGLPMLEQVERLAVAPPDPAATAGTPSSVNAAPAASFSEPLAPAVEVSPTKRRGLSAPQAATVFASLIAGSWDGAGWSTAFQDPGAWLLLHRVDKGKKGYGGKSSTWCPLGIARALVEGSAGRQEKVPLKKMHTRFTKLPELAPWRDEWDRYYRSCEDLAG